jgi:hypothetical protein
LDISFGRQAVLDEQQLAGRFEDAPGLPQCADRIGDGAQRPGCDDRIDASGVQRDLFRRCFQERHRSRGLPGIPFRHAQKARIRLQRYHLFRAQPVQLKIEARARADFEDTTLGCADHALAIGSQSFVAHREIAKPRQNYIPVKTHRPSRNDRTL